MDQEMKDTLFATIDTLQEELVETVSQLVQHKSVSPVFAWELETSKGGETAVNKHMQILMNELGAKSEMFAIQDDRQNLCGVYKGSGEGKSLLFNGHVDVVPPGDLSQWKGQSPFSGEVEGDYIHGRGSVDMKGGLTAALFALKGILKAGYRPKGDVVYQFAVGEECKETELGTGACLDKGYLADAAIVCEPTSSAMNPFDICIAQAGVFEMTFRVKGKSCHAGARREVIRDGGAGDAVGVDAIEKGMIVYNALKDLERRWGQTKVHPMFKPGSFNLNAATIKAGVGPSLVAPDMEVAYGIFYCPTDEAKAAQLEIEEVVHNACLNDPWLRANPPEISWTFNWPAFSTAADDPFVLAVQKSVQKVVPEGGNLNSFFAVSDACFIQEKGVPVVLLGPGECLLCHTTEEKVAIAQLTQAAKIYALAIAEWCGIEKQD
ncbi:MAG: ArgE/DapE family deacylase [Fastidiosipila sp.]|nr:ArgE/DapE family deacylase [Fastidiosipila sp.]